MSKKKVRGVPSGPRAQIIAVADYVKSLMEEKESGVMQREGHSDTTHSIHLAYDQVERELTLVPPGMEKVHTLSYKELDAEYTDTIDVTLYIGKEAVLEAVHSMGEYSDEEQDAYLKVTLIAMTVGNERKEALSRYNTHIGYAAAQVMQADAAPYLLTQLSKLLANKAHRAELRAAIPAIKKVASLLRAAS